MSGEIVLASGSPRRRELLHNLVPDFRVLVPDVDEKRVAAGLERSPRRTVTALARAKALAAAGDVGDATVIGADTVVALGRDILGKPGSPEREREMLRRLSGRTHKVWTGVAVVKGGRATVYAVCTRVTFRRLSDAEIESYTLSGEGFDKAGGYGIQGAAGEFVSRLRGDYFNVVGLPLKRLSAMIG